MGASGWEYYVRYQPDFNAALREVQESALADGDFLWPYEDDDDEEGTDSGSRPRPTSLDEIFALRDEEEMETEGMHSILDMDRVIAIGETPDYRDIVPMTDDEARAATGTNVLTRAHTEALERLAPESWIGRCAVLHDADGQPTEVYFWGFSGD